MVPPLKEKSKKTTKTETLFDCNKEQICPEFMEANTQDDDVNTNLKQGFCTEHGSGRSKKAKHG